MPRIEEGPEYGRPGKLAPYGPTTRYGRGLQREGVPPTLPSGGPSAGEIVRRVVGTLSWGGGFGFMSYELLGAPIAEAGLVGLGAAVVFNKWVYPLLFKNR